VTELASSVKWVWAASVLLQLALFALLFLRSNVRKLPVLTLYVATNLGQAACILYLISSPHLSPRTYDLVPWVSEAITLLFQALAASEAIHLLLRPYRGIWGLTWRALALVSAILLAFIAQHTAGNYHWALLEADRGYHLIFASAIMACFLLVRYYNVLVPAPFKLLLAGFCFFSCATILVNTIFQDLLYSKVPDYEPIWQFASVLSFALVQVVWLAALREPLPADQRPLIAADDLYEELTPEIDARLRILNKKLAKLWKLEVRS